MNLYRFVIKFGAVSEKLEKQYGILFAALSNIYAQYDGSRK